MAVPVLPVGLMKRQRPHSIIDNPFVKPQNQTWEISPPASLERPVSPPPTDPRRRHRSTPVSTPITSTTAAVEAGQVEIEDHVAFFSSRLLASTRPVVQGQPRLSHGQWLDLYQRNLNDRGHHFVVHQHDHPIAGTHYDLRLQCNATSSISFAIMYGLPGDPNSRRLNRNAAETRVHNLWNHLIETASHDTGTMLLWDTGEYTVLPIHSSSTNGNADLSTSDSDSGEDSLGIPESEPAKLHRAFQSRKIRLRLHGTRLPKNYTLNLRLTTENNRVAQPEPPSFKRRRRTQYSTAVARRKQVETSDSGQSSSPEPSSSISATKSPAIDRNTPRLNRNVSSLHRTESPPRSRRAAITPTTQHPALETPHGNPKPPDSKPASAKNVAKTERESKEEDDQTRLTNAYPGATNSINSVHQRKWYLSLDRAACGFRATSKIEFGRRLWERPERRASRDGGTSERSDEERLGGFPAFHVLGREVETSVVTGRTAAEVARDGGLVGYRPRGGWRAVVE